MCSKIRCVGDRVPAHNAVCFKNIADGRVADAVANIRQGSLNPVVTPGRILLGKSQHEIHNDLPHARPPGSLWATVAVVPLRGHQRSMPTENGIWREDRTNFAEHFPAQDFALNCQATASAIAE